MSHTNSTTNYNLPQFVTTDKPAWLTDVNNAYSAIDTAIKAAKDAGDNAQGDATTAITNAGTALTTANTADTKAAGALSSISEAFSESSTYVVGEKVIYNNLLYVCTTAVTTAGSWTGTTNWTRATVDDIFGNLNNLATTNKSAIVPAINEVTNGLTNKVDTSAFSSVSNAVSEHVSVTINNGGYMKIGKLVIVSLKATISNNIAGSTPIIRGLPQDNQSGAAFLMAANGRTYSCRMANVGGQGHLYLDQATEADEYWISGVYFTS